MTLRLANPELPGLHVNPCVVSNRVHSTEPEATPDISILFD